MCASGCRKPSQGDCKGPTFPNDGRGLAAGAGRCPKVLRGVALVFPPDSDALEHGCVFQHSGKDNETDLAAPNKYGLGVLHFTVETYPRRVLPFDEKEWFFLTVHLAND